MLSRVTSQQDCHGSQGNKGTVISGVQGGLGELLRGMGGGWDRVPGVPLAALLRAGPPEPHGAQGPLSPRWGCRGQHSCSSCAGTQGEARGGLCWWDPWSPFSTTLCSCPLLRSETEGPEVSPQTSSKPQVYFLPHSSSIVAIPE